MSEQQVLRQDRLYWIDAIRSFACLCVITTHAPIPNCGSGEKIIAITNYFSVAGASVLFFMISGALVLFKEKSFVPFIKVRLSRIALPMLIWTLISLAIDYAQHEITGLTILKRISMIPFAPQVGTYWFIYVVFGIYLLTPFLSSWLSKASKRDVEIYLSIWAFTLFLPYLRIVLPQIDAITAMSSGYLYSFYGYLGFAILGFYLRKWCNFNELKKWHVALVIFIVLLPAVLYSMPIIPHSAIQNRMSINIVALSVCYFLIIKHMKLSAKASSFFYDFAQHSFGIYLVHILVMRKVLWPLLTPLEIPYFIQIPLIIFLTVGISYAIVHLISKLPFSKYIVGL